MAKVGGSYASVVLGVSEQVAQDRRPGQHTEQVNMISDPVRGLSRRWGTTWVDEKLLGALDYNAFAADHATMREYSFTFNSVEYTLLYHDRPTGAGQNQFMYLFNKTTGKFRPITWQSGSGLLTTLINGGVSAVCNVGAYLYIAGNGIIPTKVDTLPWADANNQRYAAVWIRGGGYSRTYTIKLYRTNGTTVTASYTSLASSYPNTLNTSDIAFSDPEYQKKINDRVNDYNSQVTKWIGQAAASITPENIAAQLAASLNSQSVSAAAIGGTVVIDHPGIVDVSTDDSADGSTMIAVGNEVSSVDKLSTLHLVGKIVRVRPKGAQQKEAYYMRAYAKNNGATGWQEVIWREAPGAVQTPASMWAFGYISNDQLYVAENPAGLNAIAPIPGAVHPPFKANEVGDGASCPVPNFYGKVVTLLTVFQDRLIVGSGGTVNASRPGDYLNFFRHSVLNVQDDDPVEMYAYGAEGDILRSSVIFDRNLILFADQKQYAISGSSVLTPRTPNISVMSSHEDATQVDPVSSGNLVFYAKQREGRTSMHQLQVGQLQTSPESYEVTQQLDTYLKGKPAQIVALTSPNTICLRVENTGSDVYVYNYIDTPAGQERLFDSWSTWRYHTALGTVCGMSPYKGELYVFTLRRAAGQLYLVADKQSLSTELAPRPYMDSMRPYVGRTGWHAAYTPTSDLSVALGNTHYSFLFGDSLNNAARFFGQIPDGQASAWVGAVADAWVTPTNPFMRDQNGKALVDGRLTLTQVTLTLATTGGVTVRVKTPNSDKVWTDFISRVMGAKDNIIGKQPLYTGNLVAGIGAEVRECDYSLSAQTWQPLTLTAIGWTGQIFTRVRRAG